MKKIVLVVVLIMLCFFLCGCGRTVKESYTGREKEHSVMYNHFVVLKTYESLVDYDCSIVYDPDTLAMYYIIHGAYGCGITPYYLSNGEIGIYSVNYFE